MDILVILITENFIEILDMKLIMIILSHILHQMELEFIQELNIIVLLEKLTIKIIIILNGQKILLKNKLVTFSIVEQHKLNMLLNQHKIPLLYYVLMMLNYMGIGGMKDLIGYIFCLKKFIIINQILS